MIIGAYGTSPARQKLQAREAHRQNLLVPDHGNEESVVSIQNIGGAGAYSDNLAQSVARKDSAAGDSGATQGFLDYMKKTPAQRLEEAWLAAHHLTQQQLDAMPPKQRQAIQKQIADEIKKELKQNAVDKSRIGNGIVV